MTTAQLLTWLVISTTLLGLGHFYLWRRLVRDPSWPAPYRRALGALIVVLGVSQPLVFLFGRQIPPDGARPLLLAAYLWLGLLSSLFALLVLADFARLSFFLGKKLVGASSADASSSEEPADPARRLAFRRLLAGGVGLGGAALTGAGAANALTHFRVVDVEVQLDKLPPEFDGFVIAQISDIHVGPTIGRPFVDRMVDETNALGADLIAITGDLVDGSVAHLSVHTAPLERLRARDGVFFVTGNHEYYSGADEWVEELERLGIPTLRNRRVEIRRGEAAFDLAGVTDRSAARFGDAPDFERALAGRDPARELVLLAHQPAHVRDAQRHGVGLQLSGHTHGGQLWPWTWIVPFVHPVSRGLARFGLTQVYVNTGTGYWGPPVRIGTEPEITRVTLRRATERGVPPMKIG